MVDNGFKLMDFTLVNQSIIDLGFCRSTVPINIAMATSKRKIYVTIQDLHKLKVLLQAVMSPAYELAGMQRQYLESLSQEIERAEVVDLKDLPAGVVTIHSKVRYQDLESGKEDEVTLVMPEEADYSRRLISILAPIGTALFAYRKGDELSWEVPAGTRRIKILDVWPPSTED
jgi:regulator of nucleoside diphosphate kinase